MSDLISRKAVLDIIQGELNLNTSYDASIALFSVRKCVSEVPTAYDMERVVEEHDWILLSEQIPTERKSYLVSHGASTSVYVEEWNGMYFTERNYAGQPIAWMPLPEAYTEGE